MTIREDIRMAMDNIKMAYVPYSHFHVSAVLVGKSGKRYKGVNIENAAYTPTNCAERTAFFKAVSEGEREFERIIIMGGQDGKVENYTYPCGVCRQVMMEFCNPETFQVIIAKNEDDYRVYTLKEMLPEGFGPMDLERG